MDYAKKHIKLSFEYIKTLLKWIIIAVIIGAAGGLIGSFFHFCVDYATNLRESHAEIIYLLPLAGLFIAAIYHIFRSEGNIDTNRVIEAARENIKIPFVMVPLIFISTVITHMFGGSAGREGAALQIGGGIGYNLGKIFRMGENDIHIITMAGMSSVFAALFGTPIAASIFALEVISVGIFNYAGFLPCIIASITAYKISLFLGVTPIKFAGVMIHAMSIDVLVKVIILAICCAILSVIFCNSIKCCDHYMDKMIPNSYLRIFVGGIIIVLLTMLVNSNDYNGAGMDVIARAISGHARITDFIFKIIFTAITIAAGFKGGEIIPSLFIGSTFGCVMASVLGLDATFCAAIGMISLFCGVVNCPVASIFLSIEIFGVEGVLFFAIACAVSYIMSGYCGLYKSQKIVYSKLNADYIDVNTK